MLYPDYKSRSRQKNNRRELVPRKNTNGKRKPKCDSEMNGHPSMSLDSGKYLRIGKLYISNF